MPLHRQKEDVAKKSKRESSTARNVGRSENAGEKPVVVEEKRGAKPSRSVRGGYEIRKREVEKKDAFGSDKKRVQGSKTVDTRAALQKDVIYLKDVLGKRLKRSETGSQRANKSSDTKEFSNDRHVDGNARKKETSRDRTRTRTLSPTEVKVLVQSKTETEIVQTEMGEASKNTGNDEEDYEDDFEEYESDFEDSDDESKEPEPEISMLAQQAFRFKSSSERREMEEIKLALKAENDLTARRSSSPDLPNKKIIQMLDIMEMRKRNERKKEAEKIRRRGRELLTMITLDEVSYSFLDMPSISYEVYMKLYGKSNTRQIHVQTNEDNLNEETMTDMIEVCNKWVQKPPDVRGVKNARLTKAERLGVGGDNTKEYPSTITVVDTTKLNGFLTRACEILFPVLESKSGIYLEMENLPQHSKEMVFSDGYIDLNVCTLPFLRGKAVTQICCLRHHTSTLLSVHSNQEGTFGESVICIWNVSELSKPTKILTSPNRVTAVSFDLQHGNLVFGGLSDGTVCLWDLHEPSVSHLSVDSEEFGFVLRTPTYTTASIFQANGHSSPVVSIQVLRHAAGFHDGEFAPSQICSLEKRGTVIIWSVVQAGNLQNMGSDQDVGLAHWGKVKLVKSSSFSAIPTQKGKDLTDFHVTCNDLALQQDDDVEMFVSNSLGSINHVSKYGTSMKPRCYRVREKASFIEVTCLEICPFNEDYFLAGYKDGSIRLHCRKQEFPLITMNGHVDEEGEVKGSIVSLAWLLTRPFVFFALDSLSRIHLWDLGISDMYPEVILTLGNKKITSMKLIQSNRPYFVISTGDGSIEMHRLKDDYSGRHKSEIHKEMKKFLKYVSIL